MASLRLLIGTCLAALMLAFAPAAGAIVGGELDTSHSEVVFVGQVIVTPIGHLQGATCTGTLVSPRIVVTAAHCGILPPQFAGMMQYFLVRQGANFRTFSAQQAGLFYAHPGFTFGGDGVPHFVDNDLAVIRLMTGPLAGPYAQLPAPTHRLFPNTSLETVGYGVHDMHGVMPLPRDGFRRSADAKLLASAALAGRMLHFEGGACYGDSGGPLLHGNVVVGVMSFAPEACRSTSYATDLRSPSAQAFVRSFLP